MRFRSRLQNLDGNTFTNRTFTKTSSVIASMSENPPYFSQYTHRAYAIDECLIGESLIGEHLTTLRTAIYSSKNLRSIHQ